MLPSYNFMPLYNISFVLFFRIRNDVGPKETPTHCDPLSAAARHTVTQL